MLTIDNPADHHELAAAHHETAARCHREASRLYSAGNDDARAAQQAVMAYGHGLRALDHGSAAGAFYTEQEYSRSPAYLRRSADGSASTALMPTVMLSGSEHHAAAAFHHEAAGRHHATASEHSRAEHYIRAYHVTRNALDHGKQGLFHNDQAALHYVEHNGSHPSAELV